MSSQVEQILLQRLKSDPPESVLIVAPKLSRVLAEFASQSENLQVTHVAFESLEKSTRELERYDFAAVVESTFLQLDGHAAQQLVARLRDLHAKLLWVAVSDGPDTAFSSKDAMAQGMRMVDPTQFGNKDTKWFEFSLKFYKPVPKWLNARDWANPDRWDKDRW
ncbi:MAG: DUF6231 family protein [Acidiferrobacterales bacterium]|nr:DUF6231 family protein [Acidiferrobacterales bacterium]